VTAWTGPQFGALRLRPAFIDFLDDANRRWHDGSHAPSPARHRGLVAVKAGDLLDERFLIEGIAGSGGGGVVHRGTDRRTGAPVAIKTASPERIHDRRFEREAETLAALRHPAIVGYLGHGKVDDIFYLVMEWLDGEDLGARLKAAALTLD
jgi:protein kinase-like protein